MSKYSELTPVQKKVYNLCINRRTYAYPKLRVIAEFMGWKGRSRASVVMNLLREKGLL